MWMCIFRSRKENLQLSSEYNKLQESYKHLEALKEKLVSSETTWRMNLTDVQKDAQKAKQEVRGTSHTSSSTAILSAEANKTQVDQVAFMTCCDWPAGLGFLQLQFLLAFDVRALVGFAYFCLPCVGFWCLLWSN